MASPSSYFPGGAWIRPACEQACGEACGKGPHIRPSAMSWSSEMRPGGFNVCKEESKRIVSLALPGDDLLPLRSLGGRA